MTNSTKIESEFTNRRISSPPIAMIRLGSSGIYIYVCDFAKRCPLSFRLNTGIARVQASVAGKKTYLWVGGFLVFL